MTGDAAGERERHTPYGRRLGGNDANFAVS